MAVEAATSAVDRFTAATRDLLQRVADLERAVQRSSSPTGGVMQFAGATAPTGWLVCNGASLLRATYPALFAAIGTTWGAVDGTHFTLPDLRGRTPIGVGTGTGLTARSLGATTGAETHTLTAGESSVNAHVHSIDHDHPSVVSSTISANHTHSGSVGTGEFLYRDSVYGTGYGILPTGAGLAVTWNGQTSTISANHTHTVDLPNFTGNSGAVSGATAGTAHNNMQPSAAVNFIIKT